jgi:hypothetical protein
MPFTFDATPFMFVHAMARTLKQNRASLRNLTGADFERIHFPFAVLGFGYSR